MIPSTPSFWRDKFGVPTVVGEEEKVCPESHYLNIAPQLGTIVKSTNFELQPGLKHSFTHGF